jgi:hypothetical protein
MLLTHTKYVQLHATKLNFFLELITRFNTGWQRTCISSIWVFTFSWNCVTKTTVLLECDIYKKPNPFVTYPLELLTYFSLENSKQQRDECLPAVKHTERRKHKIADSPLSGRWTLAIMLMMRHQVFMQFVRELFKLLRTCYVSVL